MKHRDVNFPVFLKKCFELVVYFYSFCVFVLLGLIACSHASFRDFFTNQKTSFLENYGRDTQKNIIVDASALSDNGGGITMLTKSIIKGIAKKRPDWNLAVICDPRNNFSIESETPNIKVVYTSFCCLNGPLLWLRSILNFSTLWAFEDQITQLLSYDNVYFNAASCDLFFDPYAEFVVNDYKSVPKVSLIHDMLYMDMPECITVNLDLNHIYDNAKNIFETSKQIITVSEFSKERILQCYRNLQKQKIDDSFVRVIPIKLAKGIVDNSSRILLKTGAGFEEFVLNKFHLTKCGYIVYPSVVRPRKNHGKLIKAFVNYLQKSSSNIKLVIVGTIHNDVKNSVYQLVKKEIVKFDPINSEKLVQKFLKQVICTGFVPNEELEALLSNSLAMIFPSTYEGFGMPVIEAMEAGVPVLCSNVTSLPEVAGDAALFFDPYSTDEISRAIKMIVDNTKLRKELIQKGRKQVKKYEDTNSMIDEYIEVFENCMRKANDEVLY